MHQESEFCIKPEFWCKAGYVEMNQMVLIFMRSQPDVPEEEVLGIEHCIALAGGPHEHE